ncbi:GNAT family N-acetyltransferase [Laedolimicola ammoniilytica]|uniref:GNAT family N-acetyltransferase n=1 Tax=Laedolimicola ammoniilytica TaxID=2981771 RepID=A0ABT2S095_9FIRM|nr:GNAT family N-acetyltransferase [Laedolimicola ammoniilytica]MCU6697998.1 GNAT family N-acetyltransferase [Laedolimicola ammoniilytica]SCI57853.1 Predicted acetyltransferase involved in intracellular survival and related acetyltransferases [uncultured Clostridium sp.]
MKQHKLENLTIHYLTDAERIRSRALYDEVFVEDADAFSELYYQIKAQDNQILVAEDNGAIVSMLHRNPYTFRFRGTSIPAEYIVAVATKVTYRHQGLMRELLTKALRDMYADGRPFTFLMPADEAIYTPFDFRLMGNDDEESLVTRKPEELAEEYDLFVEKDAQYQKRHIEWPEWESTPMMLRLVDVEKFVERIGAEKPQSLILHITDPILPENDSVFDWNFTEEGSQLTRSDAEPEITISIADLGSFLFGMLGAEELPGITKTVFQKLEQVRVVDGVYINELV